MPDFSGWTPDRTIRFGNAPTVVANLSCDQCGIGLQKVAGDKLVELFRDLRIDAANRWLIVGFTIYTLVLLTVLLWIALKFPAARKWESAFALGHLVLIHPVIRLFNARVSSLHHRCECGNPNYKFMGLLGRSYCFRCSTCGRLLRLRD